MPATIRSLAISIGLILSIGLIAPSCDAVNVATTFDVPIDITFWPESESITFPHSQVDCLNMYTIKEYNDNSDHIESAELLSASYMIDDLRFPSFNPSTEVLTTLKFNLAFDAEYGDNKVYQIGTFTNVPFSEVMGVAKEIPVNEDARQAIQKILDGQVNFCLTAIYGDLASGEGDAGYMLGKMVLKVRFKAKAL